MATYESGQPFGHPENLGPDISVDDILGAGGTENLSARESQLGILADAVLDEAEELRRQHKAFNAAIVEARPLLKVDSEDSFRSEAVRDKVRAAQEIIRGNGAA